MHALCDASFARELGMLLGPPFLGGSQAHKLHPPRGSKPGRLNDRSHRKLRVVNSRLAFTGGVGIAPQWARQAQDPRHRRDTHFQVEGPVVAQMQSVFMDNRLVVTGHLPHGSRHVMCRPRVHRKARLVRARRRCPTV